MRSIWAVVVACLVAVAGVRPVRGASLDRDHVTKLAPAHAALPAIGRRDRDSRPELQLPAAMLPEPLAAAAPRRSIEVALGAAHVAAFSAVRTPRSSRGPPHA